MALRCAGTTESCPTDEYRGWVRQLVWVADIKMGRDNELASLKIIGRLAEVLEVEPAEFLKPLA